MQPPAQFAGWAQKWHDDANTNDRLLAIRSFGKVMIDPIQWKESWEEGGGTSGILRLLSLGSVNEVKAFCRAIRACNRRGNKSRERERAIEELAMALLPQHYPSTKLRTRDKRPLQKFYGWMLRGCSSAFVERILDGQNKSNPLFQQLNLKRLLLAHDEMLKRRLTSYLIHDGPQISQPEIDICFRGFVFREPPSPSPRQNMSASMQFGLELLEARVTLKCTADRWPRSPSELEVLMSIYRRFTRRSRSADKTFLIKLGFQLIELKPTLKHTSDANVLWSAAIALWKKHPRQHGALVSQGLPLGLSGSILPDIAARWKEDPDQYEPLLIQALRLGLGGSAKKISEGYSNIISPKAFSDLNSVLRWRLLRLYCQNVPRNGIDIETATDFTLLANQNWAFEVIDKLDREHAIPFLRHLYKVNPDFDFLQGPKNCNSIYSMRTVSSRRNFNVDLLLTAYRQSDSDAQKRARDEIDQLRKTAATSREQDDRALLAKASVYYAIATGDLEVYGETVTWQQRFVRDFLTIQTIFSIDVLCTSEGIGLLSGITLPFVEGTTSSIIGQRLATANEILKNLAQTAEIAKKEPSNSGLNWKQLTSLYADVYRERVSRAKQAKAPYDMFQIIWLGTVDLTYSIGSDFLSHVSAAILNLLDDLSGSSLVSASEKLVEFATEWGRKEDRNEDHDKITAAVERLSYRATSKLAHTKTPVLARDLIQRSIIEHPGASSWHREFLSIGYMRNLPAEAAETMLLSFATAIGEKLEEQSYVRVGNSEPSQSAPPQFLIKVTTVKYLAQLLNNADFIAPDSAIEVLLELFKAGTHIDVRLATLDSLLSTLGAIVSDTGEQGRSNPMVEKILKAMEILIPIAGNVNERRPMSELDWTEAKEKLTVPATSQANSDIPPLFKAILEFTAGPKYPNLEKLQRELFSRLVLPTVHHSQQQHRRWFSLFLAKHRSTLQNTTLPRVPITSEIWYNMLEYQGRLLPSSIINEYNQYVLFRLNIPANIRKLNETLRSDATLRNDASVRHWLSIFGGPQPWRKEIQYFLNLIMLPVETASPLTDIISAVISQASVLLDDYENYMDEWSYLVTNLGPKNSNANYDSEGMKKNWTRWRKAAHSLAQGLIKLLEHKRDSRVSGRNTLLPSTFPLRLWCLPYEDPRSMQQENKNCRHLTTQLGSTVSSFLESGEGDILLWATLADDICQTITSVYTATATRLRIAVHISDLNIGHGQARPAAELVKVSVVLKLINSISGAKAIRKPESEVTSEMSVVGGLVRQLRTVMDSWVQSRVGGVQASVGVRDMMLQWKGRYRNLWADICSWDSASSQ
ncbi:hypothetical protein F5Y07DRAFT_384856 [Xylaria sp. FL0933]|nr:hypothetical protein F5Y07DRAFT_384856 [Xylaria sp. FL0933]